MRDLKDVSFSSKSAFTEIIFKLVFSALSLKFDEAVKFREAPCLEN